MNVNNTDSLNSSKKKKPKWAAGPSNFKPVHIPGNLQGVKFSKKTPKRLMKKFSTRDWSHAPWNMGPNGPITNDELQGIKGCTRILSLSQKTALTKTISEIVADIRGNRATFQDMPPKPYGVSVLHYRNILHHHGIRLKKGNMSFFSDEICKPSKQRKYDEPADALTAPADSLLLPTNLPYENKNKYKLKRPMWIDPDPLWHAIFAPLSYPTDKFNPRIMVHLESSLRSRGEQEAKRGLMLCNFSFKKAAGAFLVVCDSIDESDFLKTQVDWLNSISSVRLKLLDQSQLENSVVMAAQFIGPRVSPEIIAKLLMAQNNDLDTRNWNFEHVRSSDLGDFFKINMNCVSSETIRKRSNSIFYGLGKVNFKLIAEEVSNPNTIEIGNEAFEALKLAELEDPQSPGSDSSWRGERDFDLEDYKAATIEPEEMIKI